jgi:prephenate dehydratase
MRALEARSSMRVAFQGESGAFSEEAAIQLLGNGITTVPRPTFDSAFHSVDEGLADAVLAPVENSLAGSVVRVYDLLLTSKLGIVAETILPIEHHLIGCPGASFDSIRSVASHPMALAQCERFFLAHPNLKRVPAEDTAGSVREALELGDKTRAAIAGRRAAEHYGGTILRAAIQDGDENYTRFVLLLPVQRESDAPSDLPNSAATTSPAGLRLMIHLRESLTRRFSTRPMQKLCLALRLAHRPGALLAALEPFSRLGINLLKIESRPIHGRPWEYQFFIDVEGEDTTDWRSGLKDVRAATSHLRILGFYPAARSSSANAQNAG